MGITIFALVSLAQRRRPSLLRLAAWLRRQREFCRSDVPIVKQKATPRGRVDREVRKGAI